MAKHHQNNRRIAYPVASGFACRLYHRVHLVWSKIVSYGSIASFFPRRSRARLELRLCRKRTLMGLRWHQLTSRNSIIELALLCLKPYLVGKVSSSAVYHKRAFDERATPRHPATGGATAQRAVASPGAIPHSPALRRTRHAADPCGSPSWHSTADRATVARSVPAQWLCRTGPSP